MILKRLNVCVPNMVLVLKFTDLTYVLPIIYLYHLATLTFVPGHSLSLGYTGYGRIQMPQPDTNVFDALK